jgi:hypothetical protein
MINSISRCTYYLLLIDLSIHHTFWLALNFSFSHATNSTGQQKINQPSRSIAGKLYLSMMVARLRVSPLQPYPSHQYKMLEVGLCPSLTHNRPKLPKKSVESHTQTNTLPARLATKDVRLGPTLAGGTETGTCP